jgi:hypothetical protein
MFDDRDLPAVDTQRLAEILGGSVELKDCTDRRAARAITDAFGKTTTPESALRNARVWIESAYKDGKEAGIRQERESWRRKIRVIFGV